ncbi:hypothetical protein UlMin_011757 [Ulmus minor]
MLNILVWNVRGLGNTRTFQILHEHVQQFCPSLIFLSETLCSKAYMEGPKFIWKRGMKSCLVQERLDRMLGNSGWLDLFPNSLIHHLSSWGSDHRPLLVERLKMQVRKAKAAFDRIDKNLSSHNWKEHQRLEKALDALRYKEERYWRQRSKDTWLKCGDRNSKFFHQKASARKAKNSILGLFDNNEKWCDKEEDMAHIIESYFGTLFSSSSPSSADFDRVLESIERKVTPQLNDQLEQAFEAEDVRTSVFQMAPTKSPGADGMLAIFYQKFWPTIGEEITAACLGFTNGGHPLGSINETIITLLPKIKNPTRISEFQPISLCNVLYKIISKMLANILRRVMDNVISEEQSAFVPGRLISDNAIIGFECLHAIKRRKTKKNYMALKLDMAKAYDRVEWEFIQKIMYKLGFSEVWTGKIMAELQGLRCGIGGPTISHLLFADDSLLFIEAKITACAALKEAFTSYETASGQMYLGLPCYSGKNKKGIFSSIKDRVWNKLCSWKSKLLLCAHFWWGGDTEKRRMHWCTWERLCSHKFDGGMGFRDLRLFNKAILAKQAWRIHTHPTSLAARVLQCFYFHKSSFLQVKVNSSSSFVWRSILWGRELYKQGLRCKIGLGKDTYIYHDCCLPLPRRSIPDTVLWHYDKSGHYTVRSGYWLATKCRSVSSSSALSLNSWWKRFWSLRIPSKIRVFLWKAYHNWIPTYVNLAKHGVPTQKRCLICNETDDTTLHALWGCKALKSLKVMRDSFIQFKLPMQCDLKEFLLSANDCLPLENLEFLCILLWRIWFRRNKLIHEQIWLDENSCYSWAKQHLADFLEANHRKEDPSKKGVATPWKAPSVGVVKVNSDAAWCSKQKKFGLGSVIRNHTGKVLGSVATPISSSVSVAVAESWALERGASLAKQLGFSAVILESDCLGVTKALDIRSLPVSEISYVFDNIYEICNDFCMYKFSYTPRTGNQVAHSLARLALSLENERTWPLGTSESIISLVFADIQLLSSS